MLIFFPVFLMEFEIKMDFDLYTGIISYNVVTAFMPPLWAEQRRFNSNTTTTVIIIINVFCRSPTWEVSIVLFASVMMEGCSRMSLYLLYWRSLFLWAQAEVCSRQVTFKLDAVPTFPVLLGKTVLHPYKVKKKTRQKFSCFRREMHGGQKWTWTWTFLVVVSCLFFHY